LKPLKYCQFCGKKLSLKTLLDGSVEKYCSECDYVFFDEPSPAVIVAVVNNNKILLTRSIGWQHPYWGLVAGHIQRGETAEEAAAREVNEETGLPTYRLTILGTYTVKERDLLMIGFKAETNANKVRRSRELESAEWFTLNKHLPLRPNSVAHKIVVKILSGR